MLTDEIKTLIRDFTAGSVATVNPDGTPSVSPKATFVILGDSTLAFGNIRSPGTIANLGANPAIEVCFTDVLTRKAARITGTATIVGTNDAPPELKAAFEANWKDYTSYMSDFVVINVTAAEIILSPAYDRGHTERDLKEEYLGRLNAV